MKLEFYSWPSPAHTHPRATLLFLHGMGGTGKLWRPVAATLENRYQILAFDQRGHGQSQIPENRVEDSDYSPLAYAQDVSETLESLGAPPVFVIGHSMGVRTASALAHLHPKKVRGLVLIDLGFSGPAGGGMGEPLRAFLSRLPRFFSSRTQARVYLEANAPDPSIGLYLLAGMIPATSPSGEVGLTFPFHPRSLEKTILASPHYPARPWLKALAQDQSLPILSLHGELSQVWPESAYEEERKEFADLPSVEFLQVKKTGHGLPFEARALFCELLSNWIEKVSIAHSARTSSPL